MEKLKRVSFRIVVWINFLSNCFLNIKNRRIVVLIFDIEIIVLLASESVSDTAL